MSTNQYLVITDGTTTVTIADGGGGVSNYRLLRGTWAPNIAGLRRSQLGGNGPYDDVTEEMQLIITGATAEAALTNIQTLYALLEQADRWARGESVTAVKIKYSPRGATTSSAAAPLQAVILGRADGEESAMRLPDIFEDVGLFLYVANVTIRFKRRGLWLHTEATASSSATTNGDIATMSAALQTYRSPTKITITNIAADYTIGSYIITADQLNHILVLNAEDMATGVFTAYNDSAKKARNTNVLRFTPTGTSEEVSTGIALAATPMTGARLIAVLLNYRNNSATTTFTVRVRIALDNSGTGVTSSLHTRHVAFAGEASPAPKWTVLDILALPDDPVAASLRVQASAASGTFDVDSVVLVNLTNPSNSIISVEDALSSSPITALVDHRQLTYPTPLVTQGSVSCGYFGDPVICTNGSVVYGVLLQTGGTALDLWRATGSSGTALLNTWTYNRYTGYLTPR
jgi:hypothetical protein